MRLLIFIHSLNGGGAERATANLANHWAEKGWEIIAVTMSPRCDDFYVLHPKVKRIALEVTGDSGNALAGLVQNLRRIFVLRRVLRNIKPDIALAMMTTANVLIFLASLGLGTRVVGSERTYPPQYPLGFIWEWLRKYGYEHLDAVVALTSEGVEWLRANTRAKRVVLIPNSVRWPLQNQLPHLDVEEVRRAGRYLLLAVGRLSDEKQLGLLVGCFQTLATRYPDWDMIILGEGPSRSVLDAQVREIGLAGRVFLPGRAGNVGAWYACADLYVMSSRFEGFPNTLIEAMAHGLPAVSFDCDTGPRDIIRHEVDGLLVSPGDTAALTEALDRLMGDPKLRKCFASRSVEIRDRFSLERIAGMWENLFDEVRK